MFMRKAAAADHGFPVNASSILRDCMHSMHQVIVHQGTDLQDVHPGHI